VTIANVNPGGGAGQDTHMDIVVGNYGGPNYVYYGDGTQSGLTGTTNRVALPDYPSQTDTLTTAVKVADLDGDGLMDIIVTNRGSDNLIYYGREFPSQGLTAANLASATPVTLGMPYKKYSGLNPSTEAGAAEYEYVSADYAYPQTATTDMDVADFNGDGHLDVVTSQDGYPDLIYLADPTRPDGDELKEVVPYPIALADGFEWYERDTEGSEMTQWGAVDLGGQYKGEVGDSVSIKAVDVNQDGKMDVVIGSRDMTTKVYFNTGCPTCHTATTTHTYNVGDTDTTVTNNALPQWAGTVATERYIGQAPPFTPGSTTTRKDVPMFEYRTVLGEQYPDGPTAVGIPQATLMASPALTYDSEGLAVTVDVNGDHYPDIITEEKIFINPGTGDFTGVRGFKYWKSDADGAVTTLANGAVDYTGKEYTPLANFDVVTVAGVDIDMDEDEDVILSVSGADVDGTQFGEADQHLYVMHNRGNGLLSTDEMLNGWWGARESVLTVTIPVAGTAADVSTADETAAETVIAAEAGVLTSAVEIKKLDVNGAVELAAYITVADATAAAVALTTLDAAGLTTKLDAEGGTLVLTAAPKVTGGLGPHKAYESLGLGAGRVPTIVKKMDVDGDGDLDLIVGGFDSTVSGYAATKPMLWVNPKGTSTALDDASNWKTFDGLSNSIGGTADIEVVDFDGDGDVDLVFTDGSSSIKYILDASATGSSPTAAEWVSNTAPYAVKEVPLPGAVQSASHLLEVEDMNNDGYMDLVFAGTNKIVIYFAAQGGMTSDVSLGNTGGPPANIPANTWVSPGAAMSFSDQVECGATTTTSCYTEVGSLTASKPTPSRSQ
jgi:hypothetical protein